MRLCMFGLRPAQAVELDRGLRFRRGADHVDGAPHLRVLGGCGGRCWSSLGHGRAALEGLPARIKASELCSCGDITSEPEARDPRRVHLHERKHATTHLADEKKACTSCHNYKRRNQLDV